MMDKKKQLENTWKYLNSIGIYTEAQLDEAIKRQKPLNLAVFVSPVKQEEKVI